MINGSIKGHITLRYYLKMYEYVRLLAKNVGDIGISGKDFDLKKLRPSIQSKISLEKNIISDNVINRGGRPFLVRLC